MKPAAKTKSSSRSDNDVDTQTSERRTAPPQDEVQHLKDRHQTEETRDVEPEPDVDPESRQPKGSCISGFHSGRGDDSYNFTDDFQDLILACMITYPDKFLEAGRIIRPAYFSGPIAIEVAQALQAYEKKYGRYPSFSVLANFTFHRNRGTDIEHRKGLVEYVDKISQLDTGEWPSVLDLCTAFAKERALYDGLRQIVMAQKEGCLGEAAPVEIMRKAVAFDLGKARIMTIDDVMRASGNPPESIIQGLLPRRGLGVITGRAKSCKSWAAIDMTLSVAIGRNWLDWKCREAKAVFVNFELSQETLALRIQAVAKAKSIKLEDLRERFVAVTVDTSNIEIRGRQQKHENAFTEAVMCEIERQVGKSLPGAEFLTLDSFYNLCGDIDENSAGEVKTVYRHIRALSARMKAAIMLIHHFAKGDPSGKMAGERGAGSRVHRQEPNAYVELTPHKQDGALCVDIDLRDYTRVPPFCVRFNYPLLEVDLDLNPKDIKTTRGRREKKAEVDDVVDLLDEPMSYSDWALEATRSLKISVRTFERRFEEAKSIHKVFKNRAGDWEARKANDRLKANNGAASEVES
ncbi:MAG TPA: AAA family ATPase [Verrucomicrobiae bacterium]